MMRWSSVAAARRNPITMAVVAAVLVLLPWLLPVIGGYEALATKIVIWAIFALGFDILLGFTGFLSFGHAAFFGTSAYVTGLMLLHVSDDIIPAMLVALAATMVLAFILGYVTLRRHGIYFAILTLAFAEMMFFAALSIFQDWTGGDNGLTGLPTPTLLGIAMKGQAVYGLTAVIAFVAIYAALRIAQSPFGMMLRAIKSNPTRLSFTGVNVQRYKLFAFVISGMYGGVAGSLMIVYEPYVATEYLHWSTSGEVVMMSVIGGVGTLFGPMLGAAFIQYAENVLSAGSEQWLLLLGVIFMAIVIFLPGGFMDGGRRLWRLVRPRRGGAGEPAKTGGDD